MHGGFEIALVHDVLEVTSRCWNGHGSGQQHLITAAGAILVGDGFR